MNIHTLVDRFLSWPLPVGTCADPCACDPAYPNRSGTNLLNADQARQMLEHVLQLAPVQPVACEEEDPNGRYLFKRLCAVAGIELGKDTVPHALEKIAKLRETLAAQQGWQPIESAPKDGTEILLFSKGDVGVCYWRDDKAMTDWTWGLGKAFRVPTHWMNLPAAPPYETRIELAAVVRRDFFDCGECPNITNGCAGRCVKGSTS